MVVKTSNNIETFLVSIILFLANPILGILLIFNLLFSNIKLNKALFLRFFSVCLALFLSFINSTKVPENDLIHYIYYYLKVEEYNLLNYLEYTGKEPFFNLFRYISYHLLDGNVKLWIIVFSFLSYMLFFKAIISFYKKLDAPYVIITLAIVLAGFFPQLFSLSAHLVRQFIAGAIFIYVAVNKIFYKKNMWLLVAAAVLTHASSILLFIFLFFKFLGNFKKYRVVNILIIVTLLFYQNIAHFLYVIIGDNQGFISYALSRASIDTTFDLGGFQLLNYIMMFIMILVVYIYMKGQKNIINSTSDGNNNKYGTSVIYDENLKKSIKFFFSIMIMLSFFILVNLKQSELSNRLFFYLFFYFPFCIPLFVLKIKYKAIIGYAISVIFILFFTYRLASGVWTYDSLGEIATNTFFSYFIQPDTVLINE